jgi:2-polyprenyl-6-methoxyphenol hydroxylase-like FAD-dependent oxidoreductase
VSDVVVIGGGPAGSATALRLARRGVDVSLVERARFPRRKVCGEYQNCGAVDALDRLGMLERVRGAAGALRGIRLVAGGSPPVELDFPRPALACDRATLDAALLEAAVAAGVRIVHGRMEGLIFDGPRAAGVTYRDAAGERAIVRARYVVGADGAGSIVARKLGLTLAVGGARRFAVGGHYRGFGDLDGYVEMYVGGGAYFAVNPLDATRANVMVVVPRTALERWSADVDAGVRGRAAELGHGKRSFAGVERIGERVSIGPLCHRVRSAIAPGALLVGDAAGLLNPFTGQGVFLALRGAELASEALLAALRDRGAEASAFERYAALRSRDFCARRALCALVTLLIDVAPLARRAAQRLGRLPAARAALMEAIAGIGPPQAALRVGVLWRLLV